MRCLRCAAILLLAGSVLSAGQAPPFPGAQGPATPTFKAEVEYVEVDVLATDLGGQFVRDLQREDFQIFEDGKPQKIASFALVDIPVEQVEAAVPGGAAVESDVRSSERPFEGRVYVLVLDDLQTASLRSPVVRRAARLFIERHMGANDRMAVVYTAGSTDATQDFTGSKRRLLAAVDRFMGQKLESATLARNQEFFFRGSPSGPVADPLDSERGFNARSTIRALRQVAEWLGGVHGRRKSIVFISEGIDYDISDVFSNRAATSIMGDTRDAISAATRSNVTIYAVDPRGLGGLFADAIEVGQFADQTSTFTGTNDGTAQKAPGINASSLRNELYLSQDSLRTFANETNGFAVVNTSDFSDAFERIVRDNSAYYVLAYYPPSTKRDGKLHRIDVRTSRPGVQIRARRGYMAPRGNPPAPRMTSNDGASPAVVEALTSPLPSSGVGMRVSAAPFKGVAPNASVLLVIELRGRDLAYVQGDRLELSYVAVDAAGKVRAGDTEFLTLKLPPETQTRVEQAGLRILNRVEVPPGRYQFRVAARHSASGALGALSYDVDVPDFQKVPFGMSGVLLSSAAGLATMTARADELLKQVMPAPPVLLRTFPRKDEVTVFAEIYDRAGSGPHVVDITTTVVSDTGTVRFKDTDERSSTELEGTRGGYGHIARVPMAELEPGRYVLTIDARSRLGQTASQSVPFEVSR